MSITSLLVNLSLTFQNYSFRPESFSKLIWGGCLWFSSHQLCCSWNSALMWATTREFWFWWEKKLGIYWTKLSFFTLIWHNWKWRHDSWKKPKILEYSEKVLSMLTSLLFFFPLLALIGDLAKSCCLCFCLFFPSTSKEYFGSCLLMFIKRF